MKTQINNEKYPGQAEEVQLSIRRHITSGLIPRSIGIYLSSKISDGTMPLSYALSVIHKLIVDRIDLALDSMHNITDVFLIQLDQWTNCHQSGYENAGIYIGSTCQNQYYAEYTYQINETRVFVVPKQYSNGCDNQKINDFVHDLRMFSPTVVHLDRGISDNGSLYLFAILQKPHQVSDNTFASSQNIIYEQLEYSSAICSC